MYRYIHIYIYTHICIYIYIYTHIAYIYIYIYTLESRLTNPPSPHLASFKSYAPRSVFEFSCLFLRPRPWQFEI